MISGVCPSCGAPLTFRSAASITAVCGQCHTTAVRTDGAVEKLGVVAAFIRELSPIQLGARGTHGKRGFEVVGVVRRERPGVRWNEWYLLFDDGRDGWLGESNGQLWLFADPPLRPPGLADVRLNARLELDGKAWKVAEVASAFILAAEGELPFEVVTGRATRYADLKREAGLGVGTIDFEALQPEVWLGAAVDLVGLKMEGLRPFAGWSDPVLTAFAGPELTAMQALTCSRCGAASPMRAPGSSRRRTCEYCGISSDFDVDAGGVATVDPSGAASRAWSPHFPLGTRSTLAGVEWEIIGALERVVSEDGQDWPWCEYLLHNPYRGFRWLVESNGHLSLVDLLAGTPAPLRSGRAWDKVQFVPFQKGEARVRRLAGEFTWEVRVGDATGTVDFICPPRMLSLERGLDEETWSLGTYLPWAEVEGELKTFQLRPTGIAPHQVNPDDLPPAQRAARLRYAVLAVAAALALVAHLILSATHTGEVTRAEFAVAGPGEVFISEPFVAAGPAGVYHVQVGHAVPGRDVVLSLINLDTQRAIDATYNLESVPDTRDFALPAGSYVARLDVRNPPADSGASAPPGSGALSLKVSRDVGPITPVLLAVMFAALAPVATMYRRAAFETARWRTSSFGGES